MISWRAAVAVAFIAVQIGLIIRSQLIPEKFFSWGPHDRQVEYTITGSQGGQPLVDEEITVRYGMPAKGWNSHSEADIVWTVARRESRLPPQLRINVSVTHRANGGPWKTWRYQAD